MSIKAYEIKKKSCYFYSLSNTFNMEPCLCMYAMQSNVQPLNFKGNWRREKHIQVHFQINFSILIIQFRNHFDNQCKLI